MSRRLLQQPAPPWVFLAIACLLFGCRGDSPVENGTLLPVPVPDLARRGPDVRERLLGVRADLDRALAGDVAPAELGRQFTQLGMLYHTHGLGLAAEACYRNATRLTPTDYRIPYYLGRVLLDRGESEGAIRELRRSLELKPDYLATYVVLAEILLDGNRPEEAEPLLKRALELDPGSARVHIGMGRAAASRKAAAAAVRHFETALRIEPEATEIHYPLGLAYRESGNPERARVHLEQRGTARAPLRDPLMSELALLSGGAHWHIEQGTAAFQASRYETAAKEYRIAVETDPENTTARVNLAAALTHLGATDDALEQFRETVRLDRSHARAWFGMGTLLAGQGRDEEAAEHLGKAVAIDDGLLDAHFNLANALRRLGRFDEAEPHYGRLVEMDPRNGTARYAQALTLIRLERWNDAASRLEEGFEALPEDRQVKDALARMLATAPVDSLRDGPRALRLATELYRDETSAFHVETLAMALAEVGRLDEAVQFQEKALEAVTNAGRSELFGRFQANLALYLEGKPCRAPWPVDDPILNPLPGR